MRGSYAGLKFLKRDQCYQELHCRGKNYEEWVGIHCLKMKLNIIYVRMWQWCPQDKVRYEEASREDYLEPTVNALIRASPRRVIGESHTSSRAKKVGANKPSTTKETVA